VNDETKTEAEEAQGRISTRLDRLARDASETRDFLRRVAAPPVSAHETPLRERGGFDPGNVERLYARRFSPAELEKKSLIWSYLTPFFAARFPSPTRRVLDLASGRGEFIHHVKADQRVALDLNSDGIDPGLRDVMRIQADATRLHEHFDNNSFDVVFCSNFLEHLYDKDQIHLVFSEVHHVLRPGGRLLILQPDIRWVGGSYWDFIDHRLALTADSVAEALECAQFRVVEKVDRFLPYTTKSRLSSLYRLTPLYLRLPPVWRFFGQQAFLVGEKGA
jgi:SAM-dependent methyltransferase